MLQLHSQVDSDATLRISIDEVEMPTPAAHEVLIRIEASPINPSDLGVLTAGVELGSLVADAEGRSVTGTIPDAILGGQAARFGQALPVGNEGAGVVVDAGADPAAQALIGAVVGVAGAAMYAQYRAVPAANCLVMPAGVTPAHAASSFVNPLTALAMVDTMRIEGHSALVHTAAASQLGRMLVRVCADDGVPLVNVVRRPAQIDELRALGAEHVCDSSAATFRDDLAAALAATGATLAFDATAGGLLAHHILSAMEFVQRRDAAFSRYGSEVHKQVYLYGGLDPSPLELRRGAYGMAWSIGGWLLTPFLKRVGMTRMGELRDRVSREILTTFATEYGATLSLRDVVDPDRIRTYAAMATGAKALINPNS